MTMTQTLMHYQMIYNEDVDMSCGHRADTKVNNFNQESISKRTPKHDVDMSCGNQAKTKVTNLNQESINKRTSKQIFHFNMQQIPKLYYNFLGQDVYLSCGNQAKTKVTDLNQESIGKKSSKRARKEKIGKSNDGFFCFKSHGKLSKCKEIYYLIG